MPPSLKDRRCGGHLSVESANLTLGGWKAPSPFQLSFADIPFKETDELPLVSPKRLGVSRFSLEAEQRFSYMSSGSAGSDPGMTEDSLGWSDSDMSYDEEETYTSAQSPTQIIHETPMYQVMTTFTPTNNRTTGLRRSDARRAAPLPLQNLVPPPISEYPRPPRSAPHEPTQQWQQSKKQRPTGVRSRSFGQPSCLVNCTNLDPSPPSSGTSTPIATQSAPVSATFPSEPLMELMEKSVFEDDDDEDERSGLSAFASRLRIRNTSATRKDKKEFKRSTSDAMRGVFGMKK